MKGLRTGLRFTALGVLCVFLFLVLGIGLPVGAVANRVTDRDAVKSWLSDPALHEGMLATMLAPPADGEPGGDEPAADPAAQEAADLMADVLAEVLTYDAYLRLVDGGVDAFFDWVSGITETPEFEIQITDDPAELESRVLALLRERLLALPVCTGPPPPEAVEDPFTAGCRPPDVDVSEFERELATTLREPGSPLASLVEDGVFRTDPIEIEGEAREGAVAAKRAYTVARWAPLVFLAAITVLMGLAQALIRDRRRGARFAGVNLVVAPTLVAIGVIVAWGSRGRAVDLLRDSEGAPSEDLATVIASAASNVIGSLLLTVAIWALVALAVGGGLLYLARRLGRPTTEEPVTEALSPAT